MVRRRNAFRATIETVGMIVLYLVFLVVSAIFVLPISIIQFALANRAKHHGIDAEIDVPATPWIVLIDMFIAGLAYLVADFLRCEIWMGTTWPEHVEGYGSTLTIHLVMLTIVVIAWPIILQWLGWYKPCLRAWQWKVSNTLAATVLLMLVMSAICMTTQTWRVLFPRAQIVSVAAIIPLMTGIVRGSVFLFGRTGHRQLKSISVPDPAW